MASTAPLDGSRGHARPPDAALLEGARDTIRRGSGSFAAAARLLPPRVRDDAVLLYAWCRHCDDEIDGQVLGHGVPAAPGAAPEAAPDAAPDAAPAARLAVLRARTVAALRGEAPADPPHAALAAVAARCSFDPALPLEHLEGYAMDVRGTAYDTLDDLLPYCMRVAGVVGEMMAGVMGAQASAVVARAGHLGIAFQLTNIARDVVDDARTGRVYLPRRWLREAGVPEAPQALAAPGSRPGLAAVAGRLLDAAEPYYASARTGLEALPPRCAWAIGTALATYRAIGPRLRALGPRAWDARVATSGLDKLGFALGALPVALRAGTDEAVARVERGDPWPRPVRAGPPPAAR